MTRLRVTVIIIAILLLGFALWWNNGKSPANPSDSSQKSFVITEHENIRDIATRLKQLGLIKDSIVFFLTIKQLDLDSKIQAGNFQLSASMNADQVAQALTHGTADIWVTIPEGERATEVAEILQKKLPTYTDAWKPELIEKEGYLFPDTYLFPARATIDQVMQTMTHNFDSKYADAAKIQTAHLTQQQVVTLASIVQREAITPHDMQYVASALENRLRIGMPLGSDVTLEYALGYQPDTKTWWKKDLTVDDLALNSPYNTRLSADLPPTPISNPGSVALQAVLNPPSSDYLYYLSDSKGVLHFAQTLAEHNANIAAYLK